MTYVRFRIFTMQVLALTAFAFARSASESRILIPAEDWTAVNAPVKSIGGLTADVFGAVYVSDPDSNEIITLDDKHAATHFAKTSAHVQGITIGPKMVLYGCQRTKDRLVSYRGGVESVEGDVACSEITCARNGTIYCSGEFQGFGRVYCMTREMSWTMHGPSMFFGQAAGLALSPDQGTLVVAHAQLPVIRAYKVAETLGIAGAVEPDRYRVRVIQGKSSETRALTFDTDGRIYAATSLGVQAFDPQGNSCGILSGPRNESARALTFGGVNRDRLYASFGNRLYSRRLNAQGVRPPL